MGVFLSNRTDLDFSENFVQQSFKKVTENIKMIFLRYGKYLNSEKTWKSCLVYVLSGILDGTKQKKQPGKFSSHAQLMLYLPAWA